MLHKWEITLLEMYRSTFYNASLTLEKTMFVDCGKIKTAASVCTKLGSLLFLE